MIEVSDAVVFGWMAERLGHYVYVLTDPRNDEIFYIGKGKGDTGLQARSARAQSSR